MGLSRAAFKIKGNICQIFPLPYTFNAPMRGSPWNFVEAVGLEQKLE